jgi:DNA-binding response OmpR family regulator
MNDPIRMTWPMYLRSECECRGALVSLAPSGADILAALLLRRGELVSHAELIEALWPEPDFEPETSINCLAVHMMRLRQRLPSLIETWWGRGYMIELPREDLRQAA